MKTSRLITLAVLATAAGALAQDAPVAPLPPGEGELAPLPPLAPDPRPIEDFIDTNHDGYDDRDPRDIDRRAKPRVPPSRIGLGVELGGGVTNFFADSVQDTVDVGPEWSARLVVGTRSILAGEASYTGTSQRVSGLGGSSNSQLMSHGASGLLRLNFTTRAVQPYVGAGLGWRHYELTGGASTSATSDITSRADVAEVPAAAGLALRARGFVLDGRFHVGVPITTPVLRYVENNTAAATTWGVNANLGFEF